MKRHTLIGCFACVLSMPTWAHSQATPTASRGVGKMAVGTGWSIFNPDFGQSHIGAISFWGDINLPYNLGVEGVVHYSVNTPSDVSENSYIFGPRYIIRQKHFDLYGKALFHVDLRILPRPFSSPGFSSTTLSTPFHHSLHFSERWISLQTLSTGASKCHIVTNS